MLHSSDDISQVGGIVPSMWFALLASWAMIYACIRKGIKSSGKIVYITAPLPYILLLILLVRGLLLEGSGSGLHYLFVP